MNIHQYAEAIASQVNGVVSEVEKANGVVHTCITIQDGKKIQPAIYVDDMYQAGLSVKSAVAEIEEIYAKTCDTSIDVSFIKCFETAIPYLRLRLYNNATKADVCYPAPDFDDLILVPYIQIDNNLAVKVTRKIVDMWDVSSRDVYDVAFENTKEEFRIKTMNETIKELMGVDGIPFAPEDDKRVWVLSNPRRTFGAVQAFVNKNRLHELFPFGYTVIPSSVHEVLIIAEEMDDDELKNMIQDVNTTLVERVDQLSNHPYYF